MKRLKSRIFKLLFLLLILSTQSISIGQVIDFEQVLPPSPASQIIPPFDGVMRSSIAFSDIDGDGNQDVLITGLNGSNNHSTKLYKNDGGGNFTEVLGTPFANVSSSAIAFADVNGNGDEDVFIMGNMGGSAAAKLYTNDGAGNFTEITGTPFTGLVNGDVAFADVDGDGDQDLLITGNLSNNRLTKLYLNDGLGNFTEDTSIPFDNVTESSIAFADVDNDGDQDVLITGRNAANNRIAKLYLNDGNGNFTENTGVPFDGVGESSIAFADVDGDGDQDVLITGQTNSGQIAKLYINDGSGDFSEVSGTPFTGVSEGSIQFADVNGSGDQDVLISGINTISGRLANLYINDGNGNFTEQTGTPFKGVRNSSIAFTDVDGTGSQDLLITGRTNQFPSAILYLNDGNGNYTKIKGTPFDGVNRGASAFADINGNGNQDVLITGRNRENNSIAKLYTNDGNGNYTLVSGTPFDEVYRSSIAFADIDNDGDQDVLITGLSNSGSVAKLYVNDGNGNFTEQTGTPFDAVTYGSVAFADIDGDGDQDVLITGNSGSRIAKLYTNDGSGNFSEVTGTPFDGVQYSSVAFADVNGNGSPDLMITGRNNANNSIAKLYTNDGSGNFTEETGTPFDGVQHSSIAFSDIDNDGNQDVLITGSAGLNRIAKLYSNDGNGNFSEITGTPFEGVLESSIAFADVDGDNNIDVLITGRDDSNESIAKLYINDGNGDFTEETGMPFDGVKLSSIAFADIDNDGLDDVLITGEKTSGERIAKMYRNLSCSPTSGVDVIVACDEYIWIDGNTYTASNNTAQDTLTNAAGCDSIVTLNLTINHSTSSTDEITACDEYTWIDGNTYTSSNNTAQHTLTNAVGCDSVVNLNLTINSSSTGMDEIIVCDEHTWIDGNTYTASNNTAQHTLTNGAGCDSVVTLNLTINHSTSGIDEITACDEYTWIDGVTYTSNNNTAQDTLTNAAGCDSIVTLNLTVNSSYETTDEVNACEEFTWIDGNTYTESNNTATFLMTAATGCDSLVNLNLTIDPEINTTSNLVVNADNDVVLVAEQGNAQYQWLDCNDNNSEITNANNQTFLVQQNGSYAVQISQGNCSDISDCIIVDNLSTDNEAKQILQLFPNPSDGKFILKSELIGKTYSIIDAQGRLIQTGEISSDNQLISLEREKVGVYYLKAENKVLKMVKR